MDKGTTVGDVVRHYARSSASRNRTVLVTDNGVLTWADLDHRSTLLARALVDRGLGQEGKVAVLLLNDPTYFEVMFAVAKAGGVIVPLNTRLVARELSYFLAHSEAEFLITAPSFAPLVREALDDAERNDITVVVTGPADADWLSYDDFLAAARADDPRRDLSADAPYWMPFTSGTTGVPKAALIPHRNLITEWNTLAVEVAIRRSDTLLLCAPIFGGIGFVFGLCALFNGGQVVMMRQFDAVAALELIERHKVTVVPAAPTMLGMMLESEGAAHRDVSSVRAIMAMGAALSTGLRRRVEAFFSAGEGVYHPYGSTELGTCACIHPCQQNGHDGSVGQGFLGAEVRLIGPDGKDVARDEVGEIYTRGKVLSVGYFNNPQATAAIRLGEWVTSNDLGRFDEDGFLYVVDRTKDMIVTGGLNVYSNEVEEVISTFAGISQVAVVGVPDETWGEAVTAYVLTTPGGEVDMAALHEHCRANLADYKRPKRIHVVEDLPVSPNGKILKRVLRDRLAGAAAGAAQDSRSQASHQ
jgi:acyl-CoA synthetase (AMP-forming)/AMP-acid ligase II